MRVFITSLIIISFSLLYISCEDKKEEDTTPPTVSNIESIIFNDNSFIITWNKNGDDDFSSYTLYESSFENMSDKTNVFKTNDSNDTTFSRSGIPIGECWFYQVVVSDINSLQTWSIVEGMCRYILFNSIFGGSGLESGYSVIQTNGGGYILTGYTESFGNGDSDVWLIKTNSQGVEEWNQTFGGSQGDFGFSVQETTDGGFVITGFTYSFGNGDSDVWLIKTNSQGVEEWNQTFGGSQGDFGLSVQETSDEGFIISGYTESVGGGGWDVWLIKTNSQGVEEWNQTFGGSERDYSRSVQQTSDGGFIITGFTHSFGNGGSDVWLIKTNSLGIEEWNQTFGGSQGDGGYSVQQTSDGGYIITGDTHSFGSGGGDVWLIKTNSKGEEEWNQTFGGSQGDVGYSVQQTSDGGFIITGYPGSIQGNKDVWLIKTSSQGVEEWNQTFGRGSYDVGRSVQQTSDGGFIITGFTESIENGNRNVWLIKTDPFGSTTQF